jgi:hypothetical protein
MGLPFGSSLTRNDRKRLGAWSADLYLAACRVRRPWVQRLRLASRQVKQLPECDGPSGPEVGRPSRQRVLDQDRLRVLALGAGSPPTGALAIMSTHTVKLMSTSRCQLLPNRCQLPLRAISIKALLYVIGARGCWRR